MRKKTTVSYILTSGLKVGPAIYKNEIILDVSGETLTTIALRKQDLDELLEIYNEAEKYAKED